MSETDRRSNDGPGAFIEMNTRVGGDLVNDVPKSEARFFFEALEETATAEALRCIRGDAGLGLALRERLANTTVSVP